MDAAQKLFKNIAILFVIGLLTAALGWAQPTLVAPSTVPISGATGYNTASVTSSDGTTVIAYTIGAPGYTGGDPAWLTVTGGTATPSTLTFTARNAAGLSAAAHSATVLLHPTNGTADVTITVTFDTSGGGGGGGGGGSTTLIASTTTVSLNSTVTTGTVNISTNSLSPIIIGNPLTVSGTSGSITWLQSAFLNSYNISSTGGAILTIYANPAGLAAATYQGTVTLVPSIGTSLQITVNFIVGAGGGGGGIWSASPSTIPWNYTTGSGNFPTTGVTVTTSSASSSYSVNTTGNSNVNHWLFVAANGQPAGYSQTSIPVGSPFTLSVSSVADSLTSGTYTDQAIISDSTGSQQATVTVNLTVNGGNSVGLTINPSTISLSSPLNGAQQTQVVSVTSSTGGTLAVSGTPPGWLTYALQSNTTIAPYGSANVWLYANPNGLAANTYQGTLQIQVGSQSGTVNVTLVVGGGGGGTGTTAVAPTSLNFAYELGTNTAFIARQKLVITGPPGAWSSAISSGASWLQLNPSSGSSLPDPSIDNATPVVSIDPTGLTAGTNAGTITITTPGGTQVVSVSLNVFTAVVLLPTPGALIFTAQTGQSKPSPQAVYFSGSDLSLNPLSITAVASSSWMSVTGGAAYVAVQVDQTGLGTGVYSGSVSVSQAGAANSPTLIPVLLVVNGGGGGGTYGSLTFSQSSLGFTSANGVTTPSSAVLTVSSTASTSFVGSISYTNGSGWLTVSPLSGVTAANLSVSTNSTGLAAGTYAATIAFTANGVVQTVGVTLTVGSGAGTGNVTAAPTLFNFTAPRGSSPANQTLSVTSASGAAGIPFTTQVTAGSSWLTTNANASNTTPATFTISVSSSTLATSTYSGNILITPSGGTAVNIPVTLTVTAPASVSATPAALTFNYRVGDSAPAAQPLTVSGGGAALAYAVTPTSTGNWLVASPALGTTPGTVSVSINTANLPAGNGTYSGTVLVTGAGGASGSTMVTVTLNVTTSLPTLSRVTNAASYATGSIAPGEVITLFASDPTHPIGPATPAGLTLDVNGNVATTIGGTQVLVQGYTCPMIFASATQVSAVVPYEVKYLTSATVLVKFLSQSSNGVFMNVATTIPGVFTANSTGTGAGAILNSNGSINSATNAANRGDIVVIYMTGEGETSPAGTTGKVTTLAAPPLPLTPGPLLQPSVTVGGQPAYWTFAGEAPGFVSGVMQLNVVVPTNIAAGDQPIVVTIGGTPSQQGVTVSVK